MYIILCIGPPITSTSEVDASNLLPVDNSSKTTYSLATGPFTMRTPAMSTYNQQLWVIAKLSTGNSDGKYILLRSLLWLSAQQQSLCITSKAMVKFSDKHIITREAKFDFRYWHSPLFKSLVSDATLVYEYSK